MKAIHDYASTLWPKGHAEDLSDAPPHIDGMSSELTSTEEVAALLFPPRL